MIPVELNEVENLCLSGGADGSDLQWGMTAGSAGHGVIHWSFAGARTKAPRQEVVELPDEMLAQADPFLVQAAKRLKKSYSAGSNGSPYVRRLLQRNHFQVAWSRACYAVAKIDHRGIVEGGTGWATSMFIDRFGGRFCECYVYCQRVEGWFVHGDDGWIRIEIPPVPYGIWAGIGSRDLLPSGKAAIRNLMGWIKPAGM